MLWSDIVVPKDSISTTQDQIGGRPLRTIRANTSKYWSHNIVPYTIDPTVPNQLRISNAIAHWQANTSLRFVPRTTQTDFIRFIQDVNGPYSSTIEKIGGH